MSVQSSSSARGCMQADEAEAALAKLQQSSCAQLQKCRAESERDVQHARRLATVLTSVLEQVAPSLLPRSQAHGPAATKGHSAAALNDTVLQHGYSGHICDVSHKVSQAVAAGGVNVAAAEAFCGTATAATLHTFVQRAHPGALPSNPRLWLQLPDHWVLLALRCMRQRESASAATSACHRPNSDRSIFWCRGGMDVGATVHSSFCCYGSAPALAHGLCC